MPDTNISPQAQITRDARRAVVAMIAPRCLLAAIGTIAAITAVSTSVASEVMEQDAVNIIESVDRFTLECEPGAQRLEVRVPDRIVSVAREGQATVEIPTIDAKAFVYDEPTGTVSIHGAIGDAHVVPTIGPIDGASWARLQVFIVDHPNLETGPLAQRSATSLQISFPSSPESTLKIDAAGDQLFVQPAGVKGFAPNLSSMRSLTFSGEDRTLAVDLDIHGEQTTVKLTPMTAFMWQLLSEFVDSREELHPVLRAK